MDKLVTSGKVTAAPQTFARNQMEIVTKPGNPKNVKSVTDLPNVGVVALCGAQVPCGVYAANILQRAGVTIPESSITRGADVKTTLAAVSQGDAQAGIVYVTDVKAAGQHGRRRRDPRRPEHDRRLPDRADCRHEQRQVGERVHLVCSVSCRTEDPRQVRIPPPEPACRIGSARGGDRRGSPGSSGDSRRSPSRCSSCPWPGCSGRPPGARLGEDLSTPAARDGAAPLARVLALVDGAGVSCSACPLAWVLRARHLPRAAARPRARAAADGDSAGRRRRRAAVRVRAQQRARRPVALRHVRASSSPSRSRA